jgi:hypothetical protein
MEADTVGASGALLGLAVAFLVEVWPRTGVSAAGIRGSAFAAPRWPVG